MGECLLIGLTQSISRHHQVHEDTAGTPAEIPEMEWLRKQIKDNLCAYGPEHEELRQLAWIGMLILGDLTLSDGVVETIGYAGQLPGVRLHGYDSDVDPILVDLVAANWQRLHAHFGDHLFHRLTSTSDRRGTTVDEQRRHVLSALATVASRYPTVAEMIGIARELLDGAGIAVVGDSGGPRWVAIRHADDHIHIAVVMVRQDTSRRFWPHHDYPKLRAAARRIEQRLGLTVTAAPDGTAAPRASRGEIEKAGRQGRVPARVELLRAAQQAAVAASHVDEFVAYLQERGYRVELRRAPSGDLLGYKLARPGGVTAAGEPVFYSGSKLAPDLSLPRLQHRWASTPRWQTAGDVGRQPEASEVLKAVAAARAALHTASENGDGISAATADLLIALAAGRAAQGQGDEGWGERWGAAADRFDRAARVPGGQQLELGPVAGELRVLARRLLTARGRAERGAVGGVALAVALAALVAEIAAWQAARGREHQAAAAGRAATDATEPVLDHPPTARPGRTRAGGGNGRARGRPRPRGGSGRSRRRQNSEPTMTPPTGTSPHRPTAPNPAPLSGSAPGSQSTLWADRS